MSLSWGGYANATYLHCTQIKPTQHLHIGSSAFAVVDRDSKLSDGRIAEITD
jgi:hypothetical protein